jgi:hypothetical protein
MGLEMKLNVRACTWPGLNPQQHVQRQGMWYAEFREVGRYWGLNLGTWVLSTWSTTKLHPQPLFLSLIKLIFLSKYSHLKNIFSRIKFYTLSIQMLILIPILFYKNVSKCWVDEQLLKIMFLICTYKKK